MALIVVVIFLIVIVGGTIWHLIDRNKTKL